MPSLNIPPIIFYFVGSLLLVFGPVRAYHFGWKRRDLTSEHTPLQSGPRSAVQKRHLVVGVVWFVMGLVLIGSTLQTSRVSGPPDRDEGILIRSSPTYKP